MKRKLPKLFGLIFAIALVAPAQSAVILDNLANIDANSPVDELRSAGSGILSQIIVGGNDVEIGGFGVWGDQTGNGNIKFAIFEQVGFNRIYVSDAIGQGLASDQWFDSPDFNLLLTANTTYYFGLISDQRFG